jgi:hypothetical protein
MTAVEVPLAPPAEARPFEGGGRAMVAGLVAGAIGTALLALGLLRDPRQALLSYLVAYAYLFALLVGALAFITAMHAAGAVWPTAVRRLAEALTAILPLALVLSIPLFVGAKLLYPWMRPETIDSAETRALLLHKRPYLNLPFVVGRAVVYFGFFVAVAAVLRRWSLRMDRPAAAPGRHAVLKGRMRILGSLALPGLGVFGSMAAWDWLMSLSPTWYSTMFGLYYLSGGFVAALAAISLLTVLARRGGYLPRVGASHFYALGRMMFAFLIFWAYTAYFQYMLAWEANKPLEAEWFWRRITGGYGWVGLFIIFGAFGLPFLIMLSYWIKRRAWGVSVVAIWILVSHYADVHWIVGAARGVSGQGGPSLASSNPFSWMDLAAVLCVGGFALAFGVARQRGRLVAPLHDPAFARALEYDSK